MSQPPPEIVSLEQAWFWSCPNCKQDNYCRSVQAEGMDEVPEDTIRAHLGLEAWEPIPEGVEGEFVSAPERVRCARCKAAYDCFAPSELEDDDEDDELPDDEDDEGADEGDPHVEDCVGADGEAPPVVPDSLPEDLG